MISTQTMTPLVPWWVFLASLLANVFTLAQHPPINDACARICSSQSNPLEMLTGVCDLRRLGLQSDGSYSPIEQLSKLCLRPCQSDKASLTFESSEYCKSFRRFLKVLAKCSCHQELDKNVGEDWDSWLDGFFRMYPEYGLNAENVQERAKMVIQRILESPSLGMELLDSNQLIKDQRLDPDNVKFSTVNLRSDGTKTSLPPGSTEEPPIDWEKWCMLQCYTGQGGSACNCDILP